MKTTLSGNVLLNHGEFYVWLHNMGQKGMKKAFVEFCISQRYLVTKELLEEIGSLSTLKYYFEEGFWDVIITSDYANVFIEYKSSVDEWKKGIDDFLRQIKQRSVVVYGISYKPQCFKVLASFDKRFEEYRGLLKSQNIWLIILSNSPILVR